MFCLATHWSFLTPLLIYIFTYVQIITFDILIVYVLIYYVLYSSTWHLLHVDSDYPRRGILSVAMVSNSWKFNLLLHNVRYCGFWSRQLFLHILQHPRQFLCQQLFRTTLALWFIPFDGLIYPQIFGSVPWHLQQETERAKGGGAGESQGQSSVSIAN